MWYYFALYNNPTLYSVRYGANNKCISLGIDSTWKKNRGIGYCRPSQQTNDICVSLHLLPWRHRIATRNIEFPNLVGIAAQVTHTIGPILALGWFGRADVDQYRANIGPIVCVTGGLYVTLCHSILSKGKMYNVKERSYCIQGSVSLQPIV